MVSNTNTADEIIAYLDAELDEARKQYKQWRDKDTSEATKHLIKMNTLEQLLDEIDPPNKEPEPIAKVLVTMPEKPKPKRTFMSVYVNFFSLFAYFTSLFFVGDFLGDLTDKIAFLDNVFGSVLVYVYAIIHTTSYLALLINTHLLNWDKK